MRSTALAAWFSLPLLLACSEQDKTSESVAYEKANVILITLDTVRADHLGCYGYSRPTTPNLDKLAKESVRFSRAFAQSSYTPPSHASILTGRYPSSHGVFGWEWELPAEVPTLAETLKGARYKTAMFSPLGMGKVNGLAQGFDTVEENYNYAMKYSLPIEGVANPYSLPPADVIKGYFDRWLATVKDDRFFSWIHLYDAHRPYSIFSNDRAFCDDKTSTFGNDTVADYQLTTEKRAAKGIGAGKAQYLIDRYDSGLLDLDQKVGKLVDELRASGKLENTIFVITADHGEAFTEFEDEWFTHDPFLFDPVTHVPLLIRFPDGRFGGQTVDHLVQSIDIMPTILDFLGIANPPLIQGTSLRETIELDRAVNSFVASERKSKEFTNDPNDKKKQVPLPPEAVAFKQSIRGQSARLLVMLPDGKKALFSLADGKFEVPSQTDANSQDKDAVKFRELYETWRKKLEAISPKLDPSSLSEEQRHMLSQLGYPM